MAFLSTPHSRVMAFKFLHMVLPKPEHQHRFGILPTSQCPACRCGSTDQCHVFGRCPLAQSLRLSLRRLLHTLYVLPVSCNVTAWSASFLPNLYTYPTESFVVWDIFVYWARWLTADAREIASETAVLPRTRIVADWYACWRRHLSPFKTTWMPVNTCVVLPRTTN